MPAQAGIQTCFIELDSRLRGNDKTAVLQRFLRRLQKEKGVSVLVYDPTAPATAEPGIRRKALGELAGKVVGFIDNAKPNFNYLVDDLADLLVQRYQVASVVKRAKRGASMPAASEVIEELAQQCDFVITGSGD